MLTYSNYSTVHYHRHRYTESLAVRVKAGMCSVEWGGGRGGNTHIRSTVSDIEGGEGGGEFVHKG